MLAMGALACWADARARKIEQLEEPAPEAPFLLEPERHEFGEPEWNDSALPIGDEVSV